jgi:hypothetical protein
VDLRALLSGILVVLGVGFLAANARLLVQYVRFTRLRRTAMLVWPGPRPPFHLLAIGIGIVLGFLVFYKVLVLHRQAFGETMMFLYYAYMVPLSRRIGRGFYQDGIWADQEFVQYRDIRGISWREGKHEVTLVLISRLRNLARRLTVPAANYGAARRLLRDKIGERAISFDGSGLQLGDHDEREDV